MLGSLSRLQGYFGAIIGQIVLGKVVFLLGKSGLVLRVLGKKNETFQSNLENADDADEKTQKFV